MFNFIFNLFKKNNGSKFRYKKYVGGKEGFYCFSNSIEDDILNVMEKGGIIKVWLVSPDLKEKFFKEESELRSLELLLETLERGQLVQVLSDKDFQ